MGNGVTKLGGCCAAAGEISRRHDIAVIISDSLDEGLGHSFCYVRPEPYRLSSSSKVYSEDDDAAQAAPFFRSISGASVSANTSTPLSTALIDAYPYSSTTLDRAAAFESSTCFASIPLQPVPRRSSHSGSGNFGGGVPGSGPMMERGFLSGPIERGFVSGPIDRGLDSGPMEKGFESKLTRSYSHGGNRPKKQGLMKFLRRAITSTIARGQRSIRGSVSIKGSDSERNNGNVAVSSTNLSSHVSLNDEDDDGDCSMQSQNLQWAHGKAGEDRMQVVISEEHGWVFVGIYDGFNGPDAPDYLLANLYSAVHKELKGLLWNDKLESLVSTKVEETDDSQIGKENYPSGNRVVDSEANLMNKKKLEECEKRWMCEWDGERVEIDRKVKEQPNCPGGGAAINHSDVLKALSRALRKTEDSYLEVADKMVMENPELALMGSCVLVMLMKGEDVYLMNVGDSRAVLGRKSRPFRGFRKINKEALCGLEEVDRDDLDRIHCLTSFQLTMDHSTYEEEEVQRIKSEHPDDDSAVLNERVKGYLKVTRAFGAGFLKQPKWNDALLEMFRIDYVGTSPYITCIPWLFHHKLGPRDRFLILSSDGLYQYFTNEEAISEVESFIASFPDGDPAQHLIEELLFRAAKKAGLDFHELLDIPQGDRRRYHDDVSIIIISLEGRIWRSSV